MRRTKAFTLIELLTVIAIIAILAGIITPVYMRAKDSANRGSDISSMNSLRSALQLYRADQGGYPPALLGYVTTYTSGPNMGQVIPANGITSFLYPKRVGSFETFRPILNRVDPKIITQAVWPNQDPRAAGAAPVLDLNGDGSIDGTDDVAGTRQAYGPTTTVRIDPRDNSSAPLDFYKISGYDVAEVKTTSGNRTELRYTLFWSNFAIGQGGGFGNGSSVDDPRQLGYVEPPESTIVTWNSFFREYDGAGNVPRQKRDIVLFLGGNARMLDSRDVSDRSYRFMP